MLDDCVMDPYEIYESNARAYCRAIDVEFARAKNAILFTRSGQPYIDFLSGCGSLNYGHNDDDMKRALVDYLSEDGIAHSLDLHTTAKRNLILALSEVILAPRGLDFKIQFTGPTGANAVEAALKLARKVTGRTPIVAFTNGFHGVSLGALAATGSGYHRRAAGCSLSDVVRLPYDGYLGPGFDAADLLERMLVDPSSGLDAPAALLLETVQGEGGLNAASWTWLRRLRELADRHGALLIIDDVQAGCGRTGTFFSFEGAGIVPDIVVLAKSLSGFGLPFSAILMRRVHDIWQPAEHNGTFRGNNHAFVTARVAIRKFWSQDLFASAIQAKADVLDAAVATAADQTGWQPKGRGMMRGLQTPSQQIAEAIRVRALRSGLILETCGPNDEVVKFMPPLTIEAKILDDGLGRVLEAVRSIAS